MNGIVYTVSFLRSLQSACVSLNTQRVSVWVTGFRGSYVHGRRLPVGQHGAVITWGGGGLKNVSAQVPAMWSDLIQVGAQKQIIFCSPARHSLESHCWESQY